MPLEGLLAKAWLADVPPPHKLLLLAMATLAGTRRAGSGLRELAALTGFSVVSVRTYMQALEERGLVAIEKTTVSIGGFGTEKLQQSLLFKWRVL